MQSVTLEKITWNENRGDFFLTTDQSAFDFNAIHQFFAHTYWANHLHLDDIKTSFKNSLGVAVFKINADQTKTQVAVARMITDYVTFGFFDDVFVLEQFRGYGLAKWMMQSVIEHRTLKKIPHFCLGTRYAHGLYHKCGFKPLATPENWLEIKR